MTTDIDRRYMREAVAFSRQNLGRTATNPSVGTIIVKDDMIVGRGVTAVGGRPHAEAQALAEAGSAAKGATAYVTLEPCAHHGRTPPCASALVDAGIARVVCALSDPDERVAGKGFAILRDGGVVVDTDVEANHARSVLWAYLIRSAYKRSGVTLKLAMSADGMLGIKGQGNVQITGEETRRHVHQMRAEHDVIMVGVGTALADNPSLDVRIEGLQKRSPHRVIVDRMARLPVSSKLAQTSRQIKTSIATCVPDGEQADALRATGVNIIACAEHEGEIALPELLEDLGAMGTQSVLLEGGACLAVSFLDEDLVDRMTLILSAREIGEEGLASSVTPDNLPDGFAPIGQERYGDDVAHHYERVR
ncbi:MAG: bifunctional diaminohydroxyphosphoribosylaminopyrimidine deaminase/5-amino-6-(5-phosphoribosylamino)uracil reductase RibD [Pseudomonadota bacterium]